MIVFMFGDKNETWRFERLQRVTLKAMFESRQLPNGSEIEANDLHSLEDSKGDLIVVWKRLKGDLARSCFDDAWREEGEEHITHCLHCNSPDAALAEDSKTPEVSFGGK